MLLRHLRAKVDDRRHLAAGARHVECRVPAGIVVGGDDDAPPRQHAVAVHVGAHRAGEHDARPVVLVEHERPLDRAGREHHLFGAHAPKPLPGKPLAALARSGKWSVTRSQSPTKLCE